MAAACKKLKAGDLFRPFKSDSQLVIIPSERLIGVTTAAAQKGVSAFEALQEVAEEFRSRWATAPGDTKSAAQAATAHGETKSSTAASSSAASSSASNQAAAEIGETKTAAQAATAHGETKSSSAASSSADSSSTSSQSSSKSKKRQASGVVDSSRRKKRQKTKAAADSDDDADALPDEAAVAKMQAHYGMCSHLRHLLLSRYIYIIFI
jgi:hypothetical protein